MKTTIKNSIMKTTIKTLAILSVLAVFTACSDDDDSPEVILEEELITTMELTLTNMADPSNVVTFSSVDLDADGPNVPVVTVTGNLMANSNYTGDISFLNEAESPAEDVTLEIRELEDEHEVFYVSSIADFLSSKNGDLDGNGYPVGLETTFETGAAATGTLQVVLRHEPLKPNDGTLADAGGSTDIEVTFDVTIQ